MIHLTPPSTDVRPLRRLVLSAGLITATFAAGCSSMPVGSRADGIAQQAGVPPSIRDWAGLPTQPDLVPSRTAILLIDYQEEYGSHGHLVLDHPAAALEQARTLLEAARQHGLLVVHVHHHAAAAQARLFTPGSSRAQALPEVKPLSHELVIEKHLPGAFTHTTLADDLHQHQIEQVIVSGFMTHLAVDATAREAMANGFAVVVASDACATRDLPDGVGGTVPATVIQRATLAALGDRFAWILPCRRIIDLLTKPR